MPLHSALARRPDRLRTTLSLASLSLMALLLAGCGPNLFDRIGGFWSLGCCSAIVVILDVLALIELVQSTRSTQDKVLWAAIIILFPFLGCIAYYFFGRA